MFNSLKCKLIALVCLLSLAIFSSSVNANPKPLGFEIGVATYENIKDRFYSSRDEGINLFTNGHMLSVNSIELEVDGLQQAFFIFNDDKTLAAVNLKFDKNKFDEITSQLSKKYKTIKKNTEDIIAGFRLSFSINAEKLNALSPLSVLSRGYSFVCISGSPVSDVNKVKKGDVISVRMQNGDIDATVNKINGFGGSENE